MYYTQSGSIFNHRDCVHIVLILVIFKWHRILFLFLFLLIVGANVTLQKFPFNNARSYVFRKFVPTCLCTERETVFVYLIYMQIFMPGVYLCELSIPLKIWYSGVIGLMYTNRPYFLFFIYWICIFIYKETLRLFYYFICTKEDTFF